MVLSVVHHENPVLSVAHCENPVLSVTHHVFLQRTNVRVNETATYTTLLVYKKQALFCNIFLILQFQQNKSMPVDEGSEWGAAVSLDG